MKMKLPKQTYPIIIAVLVIVIIAREMFHSEYSTKEALKLQSEQNKTAYALKQIHDSKNMAAKYLQERAQADYLAGLYKRDIDRLESFILDYKAKLKQYEKQDRYNINRLTDSQLDSLLRARFQQPDSLVFFSEKTGGVRAKK